MKTVSERYNAPTGASTAIRRQADLKL